MLAWHIPNFSMSFLLKVARESKSLDGPVSSLSNKLSSSNLIASYIANVAEITFHHCTL